MRVLAVGFVNAAIYRPYTLIKQPLNLECE